MPRPPMDKCDSYDFRPRADHATDKSPNYIVGLPRSPNFPTLAEAERRRAERRDSLVLRCAIMFGPALAVLALMCLMSR